MKGNECVSYTFLLEQGGGILLQRQRDGNHSEFWRSKNFVKTKTKTKTKCMLVEDCDGKPAETN